MKTYSDIQLYPMLRIAIVLTCGMLSVHMFLPYLPVWIWLIAVLVLLGVSLFSGRYPLVQSLAILASFFGMGGLLMAMELAKQNVTLPQGDVSYRALIVTEPVVHGKVAQMDLMVTDMDKPMKVKASLLRDTVDNRWSHLHVGDGITAHSVLEEPHNDYESTFDYAQWLKNHGYQAETFIYYKDWMKDVVSLESLSYVDRTLLVARRFRQTLLARFFKGSVEHRNYAVIAAMTLGDKSSLTKELKEDYSVSGASHVLALSGLHLGIIYAVLTFLMPVYRHRWFSQLVILVAIWSYVVLVGMGASVLRSAVMLTIFSLVSLMNRRAFSYNTLATAAIVMLVANPMNLYDVGFEMSFMAVLGILMFCPLIGFENYNRKLPLAKRCMRWGWNMMAVSFAAQLGTAPLVAYYFNRFSCYFMLTNLLVIPCATVVLYSFVLLLAFSWQPWLSALLSSLMSAVVGFMNTTLHAIASLPGASVESINWSAGQVGALYLIILSVWLLLIYLRKLGLVGVRRQPMTEERQ